MEPLKHECGIAMVRLLKPLDYYRKKYGTSRYGLDKLYLLMEKERNRGQDGAGMACINTEAPLGEEYLTRYRAQGADAVDDIYAHTQTEIGWEGNQYMGHLRYSTTGHQGLEYLHPFVGRDNYRTKTLALCGNFNMANSQELFDYIASKGQFPRMSADTYVLMQHVGHELTREVDRCYQEAATTGKTGLALSYEVEDHIDMANVLRRCMPMWDGGFVICGMTGSGEMFAVRDTKGIRPAFYFQDEESVVVASERPVIQTVMNVRAAKVHELQPGQAIIVNKCNQVRIVDILPPSPQLSKCSFERIYFSRGSDRDIYQERKQLGFNLAPAVAKACASDWKHSVFSFIPNTAEVAFYGMVQGLNQILNHEKAERIASLSDASPDRIEEILNFTLRAEKVAIKDVKLRTFITEDSTRNDIAPHVYDVTYGIIEDHTDNLVVIDDSIVRGTTLKNSIVKILERLYPRKLVIVSSSPQVRYPDFYGIDMSNLQDFIAFKAAISLLEERGLAHIIDEVYQQCKFHADLPKEQCSENYVKAIYAPFTEEEIAQKISQLVTDEVPVECVFQSLEGLHKACPEHRGDWYFSGDYPTSGGLKLLYKTFVDYYENR